MAPPRLRWLVLSPYLPHPGIGHGGGTAVLQLCRALARVHDTTLLCLRREDERGLESHLRDAGVRVHTVDFRSERATGLARASLVADRLGCAVRAAWSGRPLMAQKYDRAELRRRLDALVRELRPDVVQVEYSFLSGYAQRVRSGVDAAGSVWQNEPAGERASRPHVLLNTHEIGTLPRIRRLTRADGILRRWRAALDLSTWAAHDRALVDAADTVLCVTEQDRRLLHALCGADVARTVALGAEVATEPLRPDAVGAERMLFVGSFAHPPNREGILWFSERVLPLIWRERPDATLDVAGRDAPAELHDLAARSAGRIRVHGFVDDLDALFASCAVFVAPLVSGGGIKIKVLEAMGRGAAVVTTPIGAEGIDDRGEASAIGTTPEEFAAATAGLLASPAARHELGRRAHRWIDDRFGWSAIVDELTRLALRERKGPGA